jgi:hypothetical protein
MANRYALGALAVGVGLQFAAFNITALRNVLALESLGVREWAVVAVLSILPAVLGQAGKLRRDVRRRSRQRSE